MRTDLYRYWDKEGELLYVGISVSAAARAVQHMKSSGWSRDAVTMTIEHFPSRKAAEVAERRAIVRELPCWNKLHARPREGKATRRQQNLGSNAALEIKHEALLKRRQRLLTDLSSLWAEVEQLKKDRCAARRHLLEQRTSYETEMRRAKRYIDIIEMRRQNLDTVRIHAEERLRHDQITNDHILWQKQKDDARPSSNQTPREKQNCDAKPSGDKALPFWVRALGYFGSARFTRA